jgi:CubicO group peptidase (beta-lactamase class C family)
MTIAIAVLASMTLATPTDAEPLPGLDAHVAKALKAHGAPGLGIAIVKDGKTILAKGYGSKSVDRAGKVDVTGDTLFAIGSVSKSFTATVIAGLVADGKMKYDDPVRKHLPDFKMHERWLSDEITLRDCLCHRVGLERNELIWYGSPFSRDEIIKKLSQVKLEKRIRTTFTYNNILYLAAGEAAAKAGGKSWDDLVQERVFKPLGMKTANTSVKKFSEDDNVATPHEKRLGKLITVPWKDIDNIGPAGSINASPREMAEYVKLHLSQGKFEGKRLIEKDVFAKLHQPTNIVPRGAVELNPTAKWNSYGLGWFVSDFRGTTYLEHGGNIDGMTASVLMLPEKKLGVVCLANLGGSLLPNAIGLDILDMLLGRDHENLAYTSSFLAFVGEYGLQKAMEPDESTRVKGTKPTFELKKYAGKYIDKVLAPVEVKHANDKLTLSFNGITMDCDHWHLDTFAGKDRAGNLPRILFTFEQSADGRVSGVRFEPLAGEELRFKRE